MRYLPAILTLVFMAFLFFVAVGNATTYINSCGTIGATDTYIVNESFSFGGFIDCFNIGDVNIVVDCEGNTIDGTDNASSMFYVWDWASELTVKNCIFKNVGGVSAFFSAERISGMKLYNNTFMNGAYVITNYANGGDAQFINNTFQNISGHALLLDSIYTTGNINITDNYFADDVTTSIRVVSGYTGTNNKIYNNRFPSNTTIIIDDSGFIVADWNTTARIGDSILFGNNYPIGGNYWGNYPCVDLDCNGYCDGNFTSINDVNNDSQPLSDCYITPIPSGYTTLHAVTINYAVLQPTQYEFYFVGTDVYGINYTSINYNFTLSVFDNQTDRSILPEGIGRLVDSGIVPDYKTGIYLFGTILLLLSTGLTYYYSGMKSAIAVLLAMIVVETMIGFLPIYILIPLIFFGALMITRLIVKTIGGGTEE